MERAQDRAVALGARREGRLVRGRRFDGAVFREGLPDHPHPVILVAPDGRGFGPITVPPDHYWMMGDNRDNSRDSRFFGFMPREKIIGEVKAVAVSADLAHWLRPRFNRFFTRLD